MGSSPLSPPDPRHRYSQHPPAIHLHQPEARALPLLQFHPFHHSALHHYQQHAAALPVLPLPLPLCAVPPHALLLAPALARPPAARVDSPQSAAASPAVIVSPHHQHPTPARDPTARSARAQAPAPAQLDGSKDALHSVPHSAAPMTASSAPAAAATKGRRDDRDKASPFRAQRPSIVSQHSNSVPSTPLQVARQCESRSRSPSPSGGLGSHSPRSVSSEANGPMPTLRAPRPSRCKYETSAAFGRRRMPYTSADILERAKEEPKKHLEPHEDDKLSGDMRELYDRLVPDEACTQRRQQFVKKLEAILHAEFPGNEFTAHVFGSSGNLLYTSESDVDICIQTPMKRLEEMHMLAEALDKHGMERVVCVPGAKVRIVKVWDPVLKLACDMNVNNTPAIENTRMIKTYVQIDPRVRPLAMIIKHWTKRRVLNDAALGGTISSYTWICMILNFLQTRDPPVIPSLQKLPDRTIDKATGSQSQFADDLDSLAGFGDANKETLGQLLFHFFRRYGHEIDYEHNVVSVREGRLLTREEKNWHLKGLQKEARNRLCVEEPFNTERNLGNSADEFAWRGIHLELRRAFDLLVDGGQLDKVCEQFEYPPEEKMSSIFKKPTSSVKPILQSAPSSRGGRGGYGNRGRGGFNQKGNHGSQRRASSGAQYAANRPPFLNSPPISSMTGQEYFQPHRGLNEQLHDQLYQQYISLEMQAIPLRAQLAAQHAAQQRMQQAAQLHAQAVAQAQAQAQPRGQTNATGSPQKTSYVNGRSSPRLNEAGMAASPLHQQFVYHYPAYYDPAQHTTAAAQDGPRTNPSSPSLPHSIMRRAIHRTSNASDTGATGGIRSQSQPPRGPAAPLPPGFTPVPPYLDPSTFAGYPIARSTTQELPAAQNGPAAEVAQAPLPDATQPPMPVYTESAVSSDHSTPKEYVGYSFPEEQQTFAPIQDFAVQQIPSWTELRQRRRREEITQPLLNAAQRRLSRSPSPLGGHVRSYSTNATPPAAAAAPRKDRIDSIRVPDNSGPVIANGSFPTPPRELRHRSETVDAVAPLEIPHPAALGIYMNGNEQYQLPLAQPRQEDMQNYAALAEVSPVELNGLSRVPSGGKQPFPPLPDNWMNYDAVDRNGNRSPEISPTRTQPPPWSPVAYTNGLKSLDTMNAPRAAPQEIKSAGLLSPVFETRTPSPTVSRQSESHKAVNGTKAQAKESQQAHRRASQTPAQPLASSPKEAGRGNQQKNNAQPSEKANKANGTNHTNSGNNHNSSSNSNNNNSWQSAKPKNKKKKNTQSKPQESKTGEPLPANAADRKGG